MATKENMDRLKELCLPIEKQLLMVDDQNDILLLASYMMVTSKNLFDITIGEESRKKMFKDYV